MDAGASINCSAFNSIPSNSSFENSISMLPGASTESAAAEIPRINFVRLNYNNALCFNDVRRVPGSQNHNQNLPSSFFLPSKFSDLRPVIHCLLLQDFAGSAILYCPSKMTTLLFPYRSTIQLQNSSLFLTPTHFFNFPAFDVVSALNPSTPSPDFTETVENFRRGILDITEHHSFISRRSTSLPESIYDRITMVKIVKETVVFNMAQYQLSLPQSERNSLFKVFPDDYHLDCRLVCGPQILIDEIIRWCMYDARHSSSTSLSPNSPIAMLKHLPPTLLDVMIQTTTVFSNCSSCSQWIFDRNGFIFDISRRSFANLNLDLTFADTRNIVRNAYNVIVSELLSSCLPLIGGIFDLLTDYIDDNSFPWAISLFQTKKHFILKTTDWLNSKNSFASIPQPTLFGRPSE